jgi:probable phosphoglycerate mutase
VGRSLAGRTPGVCLNAEGIAQAAALADRLRAVPLDAIVSSPLERARQTAAALATGRALAVAYDDALMEIDFGAWTGQSFDALAPRDDWRRFNAQRSVAGAPGGETMLQVQARVVAAIDALRGAYPEGRVALVSHGDAIRGAVAHFAGIPLDLMQRLEIAPASVTVLHLTETWIGFGAINHTGPSPL